MAGCKYCGGADVEYSEARGETYCTACGAVLEENRMVESVSFAETASGGVRAVGQFVPTSAFGAGFAMSYGSRESREQALQRGYSNIQRIADRLRLPTSLSESAQRIYLMGVQRSFNIGRLSSHVAAACLYVSCRRDKSTQMLIDFSDVLQTPVKVLGAVFVKLLRVLHIQIPTIDPSLYMERFASQMNLGEKTQAVAQTGVRLVQAMARDWICTGRRPTGLCGAALLIAARFHEIKINSEDVSTIIRMSASTVNKRLIEFRRTATAGIKASEFETTDLLSLPTMSLPPCMLETRKRKRRLAITNERPLLSLTDKAAKEQSSAPAETGGVLGRIRIDVGEREIYAETPSSSSIRSLAKKMLGAIGQQPDDTQTTTADSQPSEIADAASHSPSQDDFANPEDTLREFLSDMKKKTTNLDVDDLLGDLGLDNSNLPTLLPATTTPTVIVNSYEEEVEDDGLGPTESLSDVDDAEVDALMLGPEDKATKCLIWDELMKEVMPEVHKRHKERKKREREDKKVQKRKKRPEFEPAASPADSVRLALEATNKSLAKNMNDDALHSLFSGTAVTTGGTRICSSQILFHWLGLFIDEAEYVESGRLQCVKCAHTTWRPSGEAIKSPVIPLEFKY